MRSVRVRTALLVALAVLTLGLAVRITRARAEGREAGERYEGHERGEREGRRGSMREMLVQAPKGSAYSRECGSCHFLYFAGLLPEGSWKRILESKEHFGEDLGLDEATKKEIGEFLFANSADKNMGNEWSSKSMRSLGILVPERITEVPYIARKHSRIKRYILDRKSIRTLSNCGACHTTGAKGNFEEDNVKIPKK